MPPSQQFIEIAKFRVELVVFLGTDHDFLMHKTTYAAHGLGNGADPRIRADPLAVHDADVL